MTITCHCSSLQFISVQLSNILKKRKPKSYPGFLLSFPGSPFNFPSCFQANIDTIISHCFTVSIIKLFFFFFLLIGYVLFHKWKLNQLKYVQTMCWLQRALSPVKAQNSRWKPCNLTYAFIRLISFSATDPLCIDFPCYYTSYHKYIGSGSIQSCYAPYVAACFNLQNYSSQ